MDDALKYASSRGSVVVMSAGNEGQILHHIQQHMLLNSGIAVGAVDMNGNMDLFAKSFWYCHVLDYVTAPGVDIYSTLINGGYGFMSGTSMAE